MYVMEQLLHNRLLAVLFSVFTVLAALCVGSGVQAHSLTAAISRRLPVSVAENGRNNVENNSEYNQNGYVGQEE